MRSRAVLAALFVVASACTAGPGAPPATEPPPTTSLATAPTTAGSPAGTASATTAAPSTGRGGLVAGIGDPYYEDLGNPGYDVLAYDIALDYAPASSELTAQTTITATALEDLDRFNLDFTALQVDAVAVDRRGAEYVSVAEELVVRPAEPIPAGEAFEVTVDYSGNPGPTYSEALPFPIGWFNTEGGDSFVAAEPDAAHSWFPSNDHPLDKATFRYEITVPDGVTAAATGTLVERRGGNGVETWVWEMPQPMATYLATVVIGAFDIVTDAAASAEGGVPIRHVLPAGTTVADWPGLERQGEMMRFLVEKFGPYPFDAYGIAIVDGLPGALENQTLSLFGRDAATSRIFEDILIHELAHQWYGNSVSPGRWQDIWLNEGFASYAEWLWIERERGPQALAREIAAERQFWVDTGTTALVGEPLPFELFAGEVYRLGAMTLHSLRLTVGDWVFFEILEEHAARFRDGTAVTADFIALAEELSGRDLDDLFREWLYEPGVPEFPTG